MADAEVPRKKLPWWALLLISALGAMLPQLCSLIPNVMGSTVCGIAARGIVVAFTGMPAAVATPPSPVFVEECSPDRRLSSGHCLPPLPPIPSPLPVNP